MMVRVKVASGDLGVPIAVTATLPAFKYSKRRIPSSDAPGS